MTDKEKKTTEFVKWLESIAHKAKLEIMDAVLEDRKKDEWSDELKGD